MPGNTQTSAIFVQPAVGSTVVVSVLDTSWMGVGMHLYVETAGYLDVTSIGSAVSVTLRNLGYSVNAADTTNIASGVEVSPGIPTGSQSLNLDGGLSPTTTKGDILVDNGTNSPDPSLVRRAVGTDGQILVADSAQPTGINYVSVLPNTVTNDNNIPRFNGTTGTPMLLQDSGLLISDTGAIQSTPTGGNARGASAVDLQVVRGAVTQVASGANSSITGGLNNTASGVGGSVSGGQSNNNSGDHSAVSGGMGNVISGDFSGVLGGTSNSITVDNSVICGGETNAIDTFGVSAICGGESNTASGAYSFIGGGISNTTSTSSYACVVGGTGNTASGEGSIVLGGEDALANKFGQVSHSAGKFAAQGDCQESTLILRNSTTDATATALFLDGGNVPLRATVPSNTSWMVHGLLIARRSTGATGARELKFAIENTAGTTALKGAATVTTIGTDDGGITIASVAVTADDPNDAVAVTVTGAVGQTIRWGCSLRIMEVAH